MKVRYMTLGNSESENWWEVEPRESCAYVSEDRPHTGEDRYTYELVEVVWSDEQDTWVQIPYHREEGPTWPPPPPPPPNWRRQPVRTTRAQR